MRIAAGSDDAEQRPAGSYAELPAATWSWSPTATTQQVVGLRFPNLPSPQGSTITKAYVQFQTDEVQSDAAALTIRAEAADNTATYLGHQQQRHTRARTTAGGAWNPAAWTTVGEAGTAQRTTDLSAVVQEVVGRPGWARATPSP